MTLTQALAVLHQARLLHSPWPRPGLRWWHSDYGRWFRLVDEHYVSGFGTERLDLEDSATRGVLLSLLREAADRPGLVLIPHWQKSDTLGWHIVSWSIVTDHSALLGLEGPTEGETLSRGLVALAETLQGAALSSTTSEVP